MVSAEAAPAAAGRAGGGSFRGDSLTITGFAQADKLLSEKWAVKMRPIIKKAVLIPSIIISLLLIVFLALYFNTIKQGYGIRDIILDNNGRIFTLGHLINSVDIGSSPINIKGHKCIEYDSHIDGMPIKVKCSDDNFTVNYGVYENRTVFCLYSSGNLIGLQPL